MKTPINFKSLWIGATEVTSKVHQHKSQEVKTPLQSECLPPRLLLWRKLGKGDKGGKKEATKVEAQASSNSFYVGYAAGIRQSAFYLYQVRTDTQVSTDEIQMPACR